jgi:hypothetical protein
MSVERLEGIDVRHRHEEPLPGCSQQPLDVPLLVGASHPAEVRREQRVALELEKLLGQLPLPALEDLDDRDPGVVVGDPPRNAAELLEGPAMSLHERLRALLGKSLHEHRSRRRKRHDEDRRLPLLLGDPDRRVAEVDLGLSWWMRVWQEHLVCQPTPDLAIAARLSKAQVSPSRRISLQISMSLCTSVPLSERGCDRGYRPDCSLFRKLHACAPPFWTAATRPPRRRFRPPSTGPAGQSSETFPGSAM